MGMQTVWLLIEQNAEAEVAVEAYATEDAAIAACRTRAVDLLEDAVEEELPEDLDELTALLFEHLDISLVVQDQMIRS